MPPAHKCVFGMAETSYAFSVLSNVTIIIHNKLKCISVSEYLVALLWYRISFDWLVVNHTTSYTAIAINSLLLVIILVSQNSYGLIKHLPVTSNNSKNTKIYHCKNTKDDLNIKPVCNFSAKQYHNHYMHYYMEVN